jgi:flagellar motor protein MotB
MSLGRDDESWGAEAHAGPWPAFVDLFAATALMLLVFFAVLATRYLRLDSEERIVKTQVDSLYRVLDSVASGGGRFSVSQHGLDVLVILEEEVSFPLNRSSLNDMKPEGRTLLREIGQRVQGPEFRGLIHEVEVIGHADSTQFRTRPGRPAERTNWEISAARAAAVAQFLVDSVRFDPCHVIPSGRGEFYPRDRRSVAAVDVPGDPLAVDRRVEILLHSVIGDTSQRRTGCRGGAAR